jgi:hypothetical protein
MCEFAGMTLPIEQFVLAKRLKGVRTPSINPVLYRVLPRNRSQSGYSWKIPLPHSQKW